MSCSSRSFVFASALLFVAGMVIVSPVTTAAEKPARSQETHTVGDQVTLRGGVRLRGLLFDHQPAGKTTLLSRSDWLQATHPRLFDEHVRVTRDEQSAALDQLQQRLRAELDRRQDKDQGQLTLFLRQELERVQERLSQQEPVPLEFVWVEVKTTQVERVLPASADARKVLAWAWTERLANPESRELSDLQRELKQLGEPATAWPLPMIERLPPRQQTDREWTARLALVEHALVMPLEFQGTPDWVVRADTQAKAPDVATVIVELLQRQIQAQLQELLGEGGKANKPGEDQVLGAAMREAEAAGLQGFRVTRVQPDGSFRQVSVKSEFFARAPNGDWFALWQQSEQLDATKPQPEVEARLKEDPRLKSAIQVLERTGLAADAQLQQALRFGAATLTAQQSANRSFAEFRDQCLRTLATPPLAVNPDRIKSINK